MGDREGLGGGTDHSQLLVVCIVQRRPLVLLMWLPLDGLVVGVQVGATEAIIVLQETWQEGTAMGPTPQLERLSRPAMYLVRVHLLGAYLVRVHLVGAKVASGPWRC